MISSQGAVLEYMRRLLAWLLMPEPHFRTWLGVVIVVTNVSALFTFGSTFWIDSLVYVGLGNAIISDLNAFYNVYGIHLSSHVGVGMPLMWVLVQGLPASLQWPVIAVTQHIVAAAALFFLFLTLNRWWPSRLHLFGCIAISALPIYLSFQNAIMTESLSSSLLLIALAICIDIVKSGRLTIVKGFGLCLCLLLATQFRAYFGMTVAVMGVVSVLLGFSWRQRIVLAGCLLGVFILSELAFPLWRYAKMGRWFLPGEGLNKSVAACWFNRNPSREAIEKLNKIPLPQGMNWRTLIDNEASYGIFCRILDGWIKEGVSEDEISRRNFEISQTLIWDRPYSPLIRLAFGLCSSGFSHISYLYEPREIAEKRSRHELSHFRWMSWLNADYSNERQDYFLRWKVVHIPMSEQSGKALNLALEKYENKGGRWLRNPLGLGWIAPDWFAFLGLLSLVVLFALHERVVAVIFVLPFLTNVAVTGLFPLASIRYCYPLLPIYLLTFSLALVLISRGLLCSGGRSLQRKY